MKQTARPALERCRRRLDGPVAKDITKKDGNPSDHRPIQLMGGGYTDSTSHDWTDSDNIKN